VARAPAEGLGAVTFAAPRTLFLIRHGRSDEDSDDMTPTPRGPQWDPPLDATGREQAHLLARRLATMDPQPAAVYCSTMRRTRETVAPYAALAGVDVAFDGELIEAHIGEWENKPFEEIITLNEHMLSNWRNQDAIWSHAPGGETLVEFRGRVGSAIERILRDHAAGNVVVVAHGGVINAYIGDLLGFEQEMFFLPENTSINSVIVEGARRRVRFLNDVRHLNMPHLFGEGS
jgi:2,3-bisphosphoglycerate-dependent phosphoglycerate mutase